VRADGYGVDKSRDRARSARATFTLSQFAPPVWPTPSSEAVRATASERYGRF
jgi:hypothetical protein